MKKSSARAWWGLYQLEMHEVVMCHIGAIRLWIQREPAEWRITWIRSNDPVENTLVAHQPAQDEAPEEAVSDRYGVSKTGSEFYLFPALADRPFVVNPETPFFLPPAEKTRLFVSTPVRIRFQLGKTKDPLWEEPTVRSSDTWFGPSTQEGEICYASRTRALTSLEGRPSPPHRAFSEVWIENKSKSLLPLERLKLPMESLSLYASRGRLWTQTAVLVHDQDDELAELRLARTPPKEADDAILVTGPREVGEKRQIIQAFGGLFK